jgi:hypothetical protein
VQQLLLQVFSESGGGHAVNNSAPQGATASRVNPPHGDGLAGRFPFGTPPQSA